MISDTHMPKRWKRLPEAIFDIFADVDLILHAGDVGELWVLDELAQLAPVVAVHGNDETEAAQNALPYVQTLFMAGHRIVLTHSHSLDPEQEAAIRRDDRWQLDYLAGRAKPHQADILIYGHTHIPMAYQHQDVWLINPGAIASGAMFVRQKIQTVAILTLAPGQAPQVQHFDVNQPDQPFQPSADWSQGFKASAQLYTEPIFEPELLSQVDWIRQELIPLVTWDYVDATLLPLCNECWAYQRELISAKDFVQALLNYPDTPRAVIDKLKSSDVFSRFS